MARIISERLAEPDDPMFDGTVHFVFKGARPMEWPKYYDCVGTLARRSSPSAEFEVYLANGQWAEYDADGLLRTAVEISAAEAEKLMATTDAALKKAKK